MYYFFLGNTPELSLLELRTLYLGEFEPVTKEIVGYAAKLDLASLPLLGGTRKVAQELAITTVRKLESQLIELIKAHEGGKNIAVTSYLPKDSQPISLSTIKKSVTETRPLRFVSMETDEHELLMLSHQHVSEFNVLPQGDKIVIAKTVWIYDAEDWVSRDRNKPYRDIKRGMLPPKVARIMVNLATRGESGLTLADPFCGTGTILAEAMLVGCNVVGSDTNPEAITGSKSNLSWLCDLYSIHNTEYSILQADATHFNEYIISADAIATEPYMGPLLDERNPSSLDKIKNIAKGLGKLYRGAFKAFHKTLSVGGRVVISIPTFHVYNREIDTISIDSLVALGYNYISAIPYSKPGGIVIRNITILEKI